MPKLKITEVLYSDRAIQNAILIKHYLIKRFSQKEVDFFYSLLQSFEKVVFAFPDLYPKTSKKKNIRRAVLSKELSVFYRIIKSEVEILAILDNRCDLQEWV